MKSVTSAKLRDLLTSRTSQWTDVSMYLYSNVNVHSEEHGTELACDQIAL